MRLIIGIGNPGEDYVYTRHNVGFLVAGLLRKTSLPVGFVVKTSDEFMNNSGVFVKKMVKQYSLPIQNLYIIHDDLDIPLGSYKIQLGKGPKDHNGIKSIDDELGTNQYWHVRVGVDNRPYDSRPMGEEYVLQTFSDEEKKVLDGVFKRLVKEMVLLGK